MDLADVKLIALDMDGTLLNSAHEVGDEFWDLYARLSDLGVTVVAASGRQRDSIREKLAPVAEALTLIAENGALGIHRGETFVKTVLPEGASRAVLTAIALSPAIHPVLCSPDQAYIFDHAEAFRPIMAEYYDSHVGVEELRDVDTPLLKVALYHDTDAEAQIYPLVKHLGPALEVKVSGIHWVDISHPDANKGFALRRLQAILGLGRAQTLAIGDYNNDLEMLACADFSYAMANAHPNVKAAARFMTDSNDEGGVEAVLRAVLRAHALDHARA